MRMMVSRAVLMTREAEGGRRDWCQDATLKEKKTRNNSGLFSAWTVEMRANALVVDSNC